METGIIIPSNLEERIRRFNAEYLSLAQELARTSPAAAVPLLGVSDEIVDMIGTTSLSKFRLIVDTPMLVARLRINDTATWRKAAAGAMDVNHLLHALLRTVPMEAGA